MGKKLIILALCVLTVAALCLPVQAAHENTYSNTGNQRSDIIGVAMTQMGYREGANNDTKYGDWYGLPNQPWCAMFISWCADQAGIPSYVLRKASFASPSAFGFSAYYTSSQYMPRAGDLFFTKTFSHVGLITSVSGDYFYTVEGNTNNTGGTEGVAVCALKRKLSEYYFVSPKYPSDAGHSYKKGYETPHPHKEFYKCADCGDQYYTGNKGSQSDCRECIIAACKHQYTKWTSCGESSHERSCPVCTDRQTLGHKWNTGTVTKPASCKETGLKDQVCTDCGQTRTAPIPKTNDHAYGGYSSIDETLHKRVCEVCQLPEVREHTLSQEWISDDREHWQLCSDCKKVVGQTRHQFGPICGEACTVCGFLPESGHFYAELAEFDENGHWNSCENCQEKTESQPHSFQFDCSEVCSQCQFSRQTTHTLTQQLQADQTGHWYGCQVCGKQDQFAQHTPGPEATEEAAQCCTQCGFEITPKIQHVHDFQPLEMDNATHWGTCRCSQVLGPEGHIWNLTTGVCNVCGMEVPEVEKVDTDRIWFYITVAVGSAVLIGAGVTVLVVVVKKKKR